MWRPSPLHISFAILLTLSLFTSCRNDEPTFGSDINVGSNEMVVYETDSTEWHVRLVATGKLYADAVQIEMPDPWKFPTREDAQVLRTLEYPSDERFVTSDGYTFACPASSVTKAGSKTKYSVLGLWKRITTIDVPF